MLFSKLIVATNFARHAWTLHKADKLPLRAKLYDLLREFLASQVSNNELLTVRVEGVIDKQWVLNIILWLHLAGASLDFILFILV